MARQKMEQPRTHRHFTTLTEEEEVAWGRVLLLSIWGALGPPRDADGVRHAMQRLAETNGIAWPGAPEATSPRKAAKR